MFSYLEPFICAYVLLHEQGEEGESGTADQTGEQFARGGVPVISIPTSNALSGDGTKVSTVLISGVGNGGKTPRNNGVAGFWAMTILGGTAPKSPIAVGYNGAGTSTGR